MPIKNRKELFVMMLSNLRQAEEHSTKFFQEASLVAEDSKIKDALIARAFVSNKVISTIDECFKLINEQPMKPTVRLVEIFAEDFRKELAEIQAPEAKALFVLVKVSILHHMQLGAFTALTAAADMTGHYGVGVLLESCLGDKIAFMERTRRNIRKLVEANAATKVAA